MHLHLVHQGHGFMVFSNKYQQTIFNVNTSISFHNINVSQRCHFCSSPTQPTCNHHQDCQLLTEPRIIISNVINFLTWCYRPHIHRFQLSKNQFHHLGPQPPPSNIFVASSPAISPLLSSKYLLHQEQNSDLTHGC